MHDGSLQTLEQVIDVYARGGQNIEQGPFRGAGKLNTYKSAFISGFSLSNEEKKQLIHFLEALTDTSYLQNPLFRNPHSFSKIN